MLKVIRECPSGLVRQVNVETYSQALRHARKVWQANKGTRDNLARIYVDGISIGYSIINYAGEYLAVTQDEVTGLIYSDSPAWDASLTRDLWVTVDRVAAC
jgi:hypothetical protein